MTNILNRLGRHPEMFILVLVVTIIFMLVIPLPTFLVDFLIGFNIVLSLLVFLASFYIDRVLSFSSFPSVLLITTMFRLALSVSTTRLILSEADAGDIINTFGEFVIDGNLIVGFVIFTIVTIVQFLVITKGAERVAEVAARFSLDGMPGKQMSIDGDLRAGTIDAEGASSRRSIVERESQLYGSFDGAMKFIRGDAIAGIIIIFINFIGGIGVGISQHGMDMSTALSTYTMLTIGDGLVSQIPALLIAIGAGFIVTRVNGEKDNMGHTILQQLLGNPTVLVTSSLLALGMGTLPGFPFPVFAILSMTLASLLFYRQWKDKQTAKETKIGADPQPVDVKPTARDEQLITDVRALTAETIPLMILVPSQHEEWLHNVNFAERILSQFYIDYGISLPDILIRPSASLDQHTAILLINEIKAGEIHIEHDRWLVVSEADGIDMLGIPVNKIGNALWIDSEHRETLNELGYALRSAIDEIYHTLSTILARHINEYFGVQETKAMLDKLEDKYPDLMKEVVRHATIQRISEVLQRLVCERISVRNLKMIMEAIALWAPREKDIILLVEHVRGVMARYICHKFAINNNLRVVMLSHDVEEQIRQGIRMTSSGAFLNLEPQVSEELMDRFSLQMENTTVSHKDIVVLSSVDIRRFLKKFLESKFKGLDVISFGEITDNVAINVLKTI